MTIAEQRDFRRACKRAIQACNGAAQARERWLHKTGERERLYKAHMQARGAIAAFDSYVSSAAQW